MSFLKRVLGESDITVESKEDFWKWFQANERMFFNAVKNGDDVEHVFFRRMSGKFEQMKEEHLFLVGMIDDHTAELVFTSDGNVKRFVFVEELVDAAPSIPGWKFVAHKPALDIGGVVIRMDGKTFSATNMHFYPKIDEEYPDEIEITVVHDDYTEEERDVIYNGSFVFLDNFLGELRLATDVDYVNVEGRRSGTHELVPLSKLKDYLIWREKEFIEKYEGVRHNTENDGYSTLEGTLENGLTLLATINSDVLQWDSRASHPWILKVTIVYGEPTENNGMPDSDAFVQLNDVEEELTAELKDFEGYINIGRQTAEGVREIYFACKEFRKSSRVASRVAKAPRANLVMDYEIYKDKYWRSFDRFRG